MHVDVYSHLRCCAPFPTPLVQGQHKCCKGRCSLLGVQPALPGASSGPESRDWGVLCALTCPGGLLAVWFPARVIWFAFGWLDGRVCFSYELQNFALSGKELSLSRGWLEENSFHCPRLCLSGREDELLRITSNDGREHLPSLPAVLSSHGRLEGLTEALQQGAAVAG